MKGPEKLLKVEKVGNVHCVDLHAARLEDDQMDDLGAEFAQLVDVDNARAVVLMLGPDEVDCLLSVFFAKVLNLQRRLDSVEGKLALAQVNDDTRELFRIAGIEKYFSFYPDRQSAVKALSQ
ncbi:MAG TPA: hypothetical protein VFE62_15515 [Gemmataceae bacterium]|nr:hypothetical protein [Gemmataceae bacterium]